MWEWWGNLWKKTKTTARDSRVELVREDRPPCPFYGFVGIGAVWMDCEGNACALEGGHTPCAMLMRGGPDWNSCTAWKADKEALERLAQQVRIYPTECKSDGWTGMTLTEFGTVVMKKDWDKVALRERDKAV